MTLRIVGFNISLRDTIPSPGTGHHANMSSPLYDLVFSHYGTVKRTLTLAIKCSSGT